LAPRGSAKYRREYKDIDLFGYSQQAGLIARYLEGAGLVPNARFNAIHGAYRQVYYDPATDAIVDVFLDELDMCHRVSLRGRLDLLPLTVPPSDLLLSKLQPVKMTEGDAGDVLALLTDLSLSDEDTESSIDAKRIARILADDWGFYTTATDNIKSLLSDCRDEVACPKLVDLLKAVEAEPKSAKWRIRAALGRRIKWYKEVEEPDFAAFKEGARARKGL
ncbi:MAG: hypothetical protein JZD41_03535, partial [Thermoproteus sp.]|nr:hypothetical protein [Thermoproteus sp.]